VGGARPGGRGTGDKGGPDVTAQSRIPEPIVYRVGGLPQARATRWQPASFVHTARRLKR